MAAPSAPKSPRGLGARLGAKVGPLPVWAWAASILAAYFLYSRMRPPAATTTADTASASTTDGTTGAAQTPVSGQGTPADNLNGGLLDALGANSASIDALTTQILSQPPASGGQGDTSSLTSAAMSSAASDPVWYELATQTPGNQFYGLPDYANRSTPVYAQQLQTAAAQSRQSDPAWFQRATQTPSSPFYGLPAAA